jgi:hypothetical protein
MIYLFDFIVVNFNIGEDNNDITYLRQATKIYLMIEYPNFLFKYNNMVLISADP